jgi:hypothetical protein
VACSVIVVFVDMREEEGKEVLRKIGRIDKRRYRLDLDTFYECRFAYLSAQRKASRHTLIVALNIGIMHG